MTGFSAAWLSLREPFDARARNAEVLAEVAAALAHLPSVTIVDLACGTGSTRRAIAARLPRPQHWRMVDNDMGLLARATAGPSIDGGTARPTLLDLVHDVETALDGAPDLVTTSALLDLVSDAWLERLVVECAARRLPLYAALTYDGEMVFDPVDALDRDIVVSVNRHQRRDKGFGPALGGEACAALPAQCRLVGYDVSHANSDWMVGPHEPEFQHAVMSELARAATETGDIPAARIESWLRRRSQFIETGRSGLRVGHCDVFARPSATR